MSPRRPADYDEDDVRVRPNPRGSRPRTKDRPRHESAETGLVVRVDRGRYGVIVGEEALSWYGIAKVGRKEEWPSWTPTADIKKRLDVPNFVEGGAHNPMGARGIYLYQANKDTLFRIHGTNQPEYIGQAISSGCIRMTNEDVIDLYNHVKMGAIVVVLAPKAGDAPVNPQVAAATDPRFN